MSHGTPTAGDARRRIYLLRHAEVAYFAQPGVTSDQVALTDDGAEQARAAGRALAQVQFDRVVTSGVPRTDETARLIVESLEQPPSGEPEAWPELVEMRPGRLSEIPDDQIEQAFLGVFQGIPSPEASYLQGEPVRSLVQRVGAAVARLYADPSWRTMLLVLHGGVNRAVLSWCLAGPGAFFGHLEQSYGCINVIDGGPGDFNLRTVNYTPYDPVHLGTRKTAIEVIVDEYWSQRNSR